MTSLNEYYDDIRKEIGIEFGLEALGYGSPRITNEQIKNAQKKFHEMTEDEQNALLASRGYYLTKDDLFDQDDLLGL